MYIRRPGFCDSRAENLELSTATASRITTPPIRRSDVVQPCACMAGIVKATRGISSYRYPSASLTVLIQHRTCTAYPSLCFAEYTIAIPPMSTANSPAADSPIDEAIKYICANHFHRVLWLPPTAVHDKLRVTYSTTSNFTDESLPVALFCAPMFGSRWDSIFVDHLASTVGLRAICVDRSVLLVPPLPLRSESTAVIWHTLYIAGRRLDGAESLLK